VERRQFLSGTAVGALGGAALTIGGMVSAGCRRDTAGGAGASSGVAGGGKTSYAAMGEDLIVGALLRDVLKIEKPTYLDIGAADPVAVNNTYLLYTQGSRGVLVEPNPTYVERLRAVRPGDVVVGAGIGGGEAREADYYVIKDKPMLNTFSFETAELRRRNGDQVERVMKMPLVPVMAVIAEHLTAAPDLLSIDAEGMDLEITQSLDLTKYRPPVICAETKGPTATHESTPLAQYLVTKGYIVTAGTIYNTILVDRSRLG
jgi:FkbM family methyltransferase